MDTSSIRAFQALPKHIRALAEDQAQKDSEFLIGFQIEDSTAWDFLRYLDSNTCRKSIKNFLYNVAANSTISSTNNSYILENEILLSSLGLTPERVLDLFYSESRKTICHHDGFDCSISIWKFSPFWYEVNLVFKFCTDYGKAIVEIRRSFELLEVFDYKRSWGLLFGMVLEGFKRFKKSTFYKRAAAIVRETGQSIETLHRFTPWYNLSAYVDDRPYVPLTDLKTLKVITAYHGESGTLPECFVVERGRYMKIFRKIKKEAKVYDR